MTTWNTAAADVWSAVALHLWQTTLVLAALLLLDRLLTRAPARYRVAIWWLGALKLALPAGLLAAWLPARAASVASADLVTRVRILTEPLDPVFRPQVLQQSGWPPVLLTAIWAAGLAAIGSLVLRRWHRLPRGGRPGAEQTAVRKAAAECGVDPRIVRVARGPQTPCLVGVLRPRILISERTVDSLTRSELCAVLLHEDVHRRRRDPLRQLALLPVALAYWFYPPTWWLLRRLGDAEESACDEAVLAAGIRPSVYARAIARAVESALEMPLGAVSLAGSNRASLSRRLRQLPDVNRRRAMSRHRLAVVIAVLAVLGVALVNEGPVLTAAPQEPALAGTTERPQGAAVLQRRGDTLYRLGPAGERRLSMVATQQPLGEVLDHIAQVGGFTIAVGAGDDVDLGRPISIRLTNSTVVEALRGVAQVAGIAYLAESADLVLVWSGPFRVGGEVRAPVRVHYEPPSYPETARADGAGGTVVLELELDREGNVTDAVIVRGVREDLDEAARAAALAWRYEPVRYNEQSVPALLTVTVKFHLQ